MSASGINNTYDVVIIGSGIGGLTAGALLAKHGKRVLVVEQEQEPGGFARDFKYGPYTINPSLHAIMGCNPDGPLGPGIIYSLLDDLGVQEMCEFISLDTFYRALLPGFQLDVPTGWEAFLEAYMKHFPQEEGGLRKLSRLYAKIQGEFMRLPAQMKLLDWLQFPFRSPQIFRHANSSLEAVLDRHLSDKKLKSAYSIVYPYLALPPSRLSFLLWAVMVADYVEGGTYYCPGGFQKFVGTLVQGFENHGGELLPGSPVTQIKKKNRIFEIEINHSQHIFSHQLISNIDPRLIFNQLLAEPQVNDKYLQKMNAMKESCSTIGLLLATDIDVQEVDAAKVTIISDWDLESAFSAAQHGEIKGAAVHIPSVDDPSLAPHGENIVIIQAFAPTSKDNLTPEIRAHLTNQLLQMAERILPDLRNHVTFTFGNEGNLEDGTSLHTIGPMYGWENSFHQTGFRRLSPITPIEDLYLTGHWTQPGSGIWTVVLSGMLTARILLDRDLSKPIWPLR